ncbi:MAG: glycosyltransferase family 4 protein, partial [Candidatus Sulfotelmatobacter sp.]
FYSDSAGFGGHEAMTLEAVRCLCQREDTAVSAIYYEGNIRLGDGLNHIARATGNLSLFPSIFVSKSLPAFRSLVSVRKIAALSRLMRQINPGVVVVSQGRIEAGSLALLAARHAGLRTISYLPMAHPVSVSGKPIALRLRETVNGYFYRLPDRVITISGSAQRMLVERGARDVVVVPNGIDVRPSVPCDRGTFRREHGICGEEYVVGIIGRIDFRQKGQDFAVEAIRLFQHQLEGYRFVFVGEGPDQQKLNATISRSALSHMVQVLPWSRNPQQVYAGLDMLMIPSHFEGVPLVMLEAMAYRLPIIASNVDAMAELLPSNWLFPFGNHQALFQRLTQVRAADNSSVLELHRKLILESFTRKQFCSNMSVAVLQPTAVPLECYAER